ncbi:MAG: hypothetical protein Q8Q89_01160 [bacterium]|nr:hypothetical protein [bacterium]
MFKILKRIKVESYLISRLLNPKYSPACRFNFKCYMRYFKNRFLGDFLVSRIKPIYFSPRPDFELHMLSQGGNLWISVCSIRSFLCQSKLCPKIVIHDDGSMSEKSIGILKNKFSGLEVITRKEADDLIFNKLGLPDKIKESRKSRNNLILRVVDFPLLSRANKIMIMGDDILFFKRPQEIIDFVEGRSPYQSLISEQSGDYDLGMDEYYASKYQLIKKRVGYMNADLIVFERNIFTVDKILEFFEHSIKGPDYYFSEMAAMGSIISQSNFNFLPKDKYHIKSAVNENTVAKHFTGPRRQDYFAYGIDLAELKIKSIKT